jgi:DNA-binding CsgD family transcriptional regulator
VQAPPPQPQPPAQPHGGPREGTDRPPRIAARVQRYLDAAAVLGEAEVARLWAAGLELTSSAAAELALEPSGRPGAAGPPAAEDGVVPESGPPESGPRGGGRLRLEVPQPAWPEPPAAWPAQPGPAALTAREREVVALIALGRSNKAIAQELFISPATAARHVANILGKLGYSSRSQVAAWAAAANSGRRTGR